MRSIFRRSHNHMLGPNQRPCPLCGKPMNRQSPRCLACARADPAWRQRMSEARKGKPSYQRTEAWKQAMSDRLKGQPKPYLKGRKRPEHSQLMKDWWTPERRAAMALRLSKPDARYHGLSSRQAAALVASVGHCERCSHDGSESRLGIHHRDRDKHNQARDNLEVLCHRCHMREHADAQETGWDVYHQKRRTSQR
jgi:NUMOD3 motif-containing protein